MNHDQNIAVVTGGAGFIGSHLVDLLLARGYEARVVDNLIAGKRERVPAAAAFFDADIRDAEALKEAFAGVRFVFHLAALPRVQDTIEHPAETHDTNVTGTLQVLEAARAAGAARVVFASSAAIYGDNEHTPLREDEPPEPLSPYALHKLISEQYLRLYAKIFNLRTTSLRFFNVYGPRFDPEGPYALVVGRFLKLSKEGRPLTIVGDGEQMRDYVHVSDVARALLAAAESDALGAGEVVNIGTGIATSVNALAGHFGGEKVYLPPRLEPRTSVADISRARELLGWAPSVTLADGIVELKKEHVSPILSS